MLKNNYGQYIDHVNKQKQLKKFLGQTAKLQAYQAYKEREENNLEI